MALKNNKSGSAESDSRQRSAQNVSGVFIANTGRPNFETNSFLTLTGHDEQDTGAHAGGCKPERIHEPESGSLQPL